MWNGVLALPASWFGGRVPGGEGARARRTRERQTDVVSHRESSVPDNSVIARLQRGDADALDALMLEHSAGLIRYAASIVGSRDAAEDVVQDVFIKVWNVRSSALPSGDVGAYLLRMTRNRALDVMRHERAQAVRSQSQLDTETVRYNEGAVAVEADELSRLLRRAVDSLPERSRDVFLMRRRSGMSSSAVAQALGITVAAVHVHLSRALRRIAAALQIPPER